MVNLFLPVILFIGFGYSLACDKGKDVCVSIPCSATDKNVVFSSSGTSENRVYLNLTSYQGAVTACAGQILSEHATTLSPPTTSTPQGTTAKPVLPTEAEPTGYTGPYGINYYWRDYDGTIPFDAIPVGTDESGKTTYFGSGYYSFGGVVPGEIREGDKNIYSHMGQVLYTTTVNAKILCAPPNRQPKWFKVDLDHIDRLTKCIFIKEGYYHDTEFYLARAHHNGKYVVGKVFPKGHMYEGMEIWDDKIVFFSTGFEILGYC